MGYSCLRLESDRNSVLDIQMNDINCGRYLTTNSFQVHNTASELTRHGSKIVLNRQGANRDSDVVESCYKVCIS